MLKLLKNTKRHFMTGVSYMIPFVVAGGVLLALAVMFNGEAAVPDHGFLKAMSQIGMAVYPHPVRIYRVFDGR